LICCGHVLLVDVRKYVSHASFVLADIMSKFLCHFLNCVRSSGARYCVVFHQKFLIDVPLWMCYRQQVWIRVFLVKRVLSLLWKWLVTDSAIVATLFPEHSGSYFCGG
jgi:hypothetical protein